MSQAADLILREIALFWVLMAVGKWIDSLIVSLSSPERESATASFAIVNVQIAVMTACVTLVFSKGVARATLPGSGMLYAFAFLSTQDAFKRRVARASKSI